MLSEDMTDCWRGRRPQLMRLIDELIERGAIARIDDRLRGRRVRSARSPGT